jgi:hypothetical protein
VPAGQARSNAHAEGWQLIFGETFEGGIGSDWDVVDWTTSTFTAASGDRSAWCAGGVHGVGGFYTDGMDVWLVSNPITLAGSGSALWDAEVQFAWWLDTSLGAEGEAGTLDPRSGQLVDAPPPAGDWFGWGVVTGVTSLESGREPPGQWTYVSGGTAGWMGGSLPLGSFLPPSEDLTSTVRVAFRFVSDDDGAVGRGAFVDDVALRVNDGYDSWFPLVLRQPPPTPAPTPTATPSPTPSLALRNGSFEEGWYNVIIGQVPNDWEWHWVDGEVLPGSDDPAFAPETRVLPKDQLPGYEQDLFILDGFYCIKVFKEHSPIYAALSQDLSGLEQGRQYRFTVPIYVDVFNWEGGKVPPTDPWSAQLRLGVAPIGATWRDEEAISYSGWWNGDNTADFYLNYNDFSFDFAATETEMTVYVEVFAKWGLDNNGFFMDDAKLLLLP